MPTNRAEKMMEQRVDVENPDEAVDAMSSAESLDEVRHSVCLGTALPTPAAHWSNVLMFIYLESKDSKCPYS